MTILRYIKADAEKVPKTIGYKLNYNLATLEDQEEALKKNSTYYAYSFARNVPGADIRRCEEVACKSPRWAYWFALYVPGADIRRCEEVACKEPYWAYQFAFNVPEADIGKCEKAACKDPYWAYEFVRLPGADRKKCMKAAER